MAPKIWGHEEVSVSSPTGVCLSMDTKKLYNSIQISWCQPRGPRVKSRAHFILEKHFN